MTNRYQDFLIIIHRIYTQET